MGPINTSFKSAGNIEQKKFKSRVYFSLYTVLQSRNWVTYFMGLNDG